MSVDLEALAQDLRGVVSHVYAPVNVPSRRPALMVAGSCVELDPPGVHIRGYVSPAVIAIVARHLAAGDSDRTEEGG